MKHLTIIVFLATSISFFAQVEYNIKNEYIAKGYDVVGYFSDKALKGNERFTTKYHGVRLKFATKENLITFKENPEKYFPQYGGFCAYAMALNGEKVDINPKKFEIRDDKLYLFYSSWGNDTLKSWKKENPKKLQKQADINWKILVSQ